MTLPHGAHAPAAHGVARVADVPAASHVVGVEDVHAHDLAGLRDAGNTAVRLLGEEFCGFLGGQAFILREGDAVLDHLVPDVGHRGHVEGGIGTHDKRLVQSREFVGAHDARADGCHVFEVGLLHFG